MFHRKIIYFLLLFLFSVSLILAGIIYDCQSQNLKVIFFDVGQGDAILIKQGRNQILIDGGPSGQKELEKLGQHLPFWDRKIEAIIATHPDKDHIAGLVAVMENYKIGAVIDNGAESDSGIYRRYLETATGQKIKRLKGEAGMRIKLNGAELEIFYPRAEENNFDDTNAGSLVAKLVFGKNSFLFAGDLPREKEGELLEKDLKANVLKIAHHGSKGSTGSDFLKKIAPVDAIISVGKNNSYGHPVVEVLENLKVGNINIFRTDEKGDIEYVCASAEIDCEVNPEF